MLPQFLFDIVLWWIVGCLLWLMPMVWVSARLPDERVGGRYAQYWLGWFRWSLIFNLAGWSLTPAVILGTATTYWDTTQNEIRRQMKDRLTTVETQMQTLTHQATEIVHSVADAQERVLAAEDALARLYDWQQRRWLSH